MAGEIERRRSAVLQGTSDSAEALLVTVPGNMRYLTGFTGSNGQLLMAERPVLFTDGRYTEQAAEQSPGIERVIYPAGGMYASIRDAVTERGIGKLAFEAGHPEPGASLGRDAPGYMTVLEHERFGEAMRGIALIPTSDIVERVRIRKSPGEIDAMRRAQRIAEAAVWETLRTWRGGTEKDLALALEWAIRTGGAAGLSFDVIAASGPQAALPHARPRDVEVDPAGLLLIDIGARVDGYCSDMTRTYFLGGNVPEPLHRAFDAVVRAVEAGCAAVRPGAHGRDVDRAARDLIEAEGFGDAFVHGLGHGVGLDVHEPPRLSKVSTSVLEPGMVVTIEPGVYLPGVGGIRVEDLLVVTDDGCENLTAVPRGHRIPS